MTIDIEHLKSEIANLNHLIQEYEEIYLNLYHELSFSNHYWNDGYSIHFYDEISREKPIVLASIEEIKEFKSYYEWIISQYQEIGKKMFIKLNKKSFILKKIDRYIFILNETIALFSKLNSNFNVKEYYSLMQLKNRILDEKETMKKLRKKVQNLFSLMEKTENQMMQKLKKLEVTSVKEQDISNLW